jgi:hypothetical protein
MLTQSAELSAIKYSRINRAYPSASSAAMLAGSVVALTAMYVTTEMERVVPTHVWG